MVEMIWIGFLGKRGGGLHLLWETERVLKDQGFSILSIVSIRENSKIEKSKLVSTPGPSVFEVLHFLTFPFLSFMFFFRSRKNLPKALIQIMPSPMDYWLDIWANLFQIEIYRAIHDFEPHPGEFWPTKLAIKRRIKFATKLFVFSEYVYENLRSITDKEIYLCSLPDEIPYTGEISRKLVEIIRPMKSPLVLFIGRIKKYKGLDFFLSTLEKNPELECSILIAGSGSLKFKARENVHFWNKWLSEAEINYLLTESNIIVVPYLEASQSGVIPLAIKFNKTILATKVGSLEEQLIGYKKKVLVEPGDEDSLVRGLEASVQMSAENVLVEENSKATNCPSLGGQVINILKNPQKGENFG